MSWRHRLRTIFVCVMLEWAALGGAAMRPEEIEELMRTMNKPKLAHVIPDESDHGDGDHDDTTTRRRNDAMKRTENLEPPCTMPHAQTDG